MPAKLTQRLLLGTILVLWCTGLACGAQALWRYSTTPGSDQSAPLHWPAEAPFSPRPGRATLVMFAHPKCPCTRASLAEFSRLMARGDVDGLVFFARPEGAETGWEHTGLWKTAEEIPGTRVLADIDESAARIFGAETSGHVLFYDASGTLRYSGGITASRGHEGPNAGSDAISTAMGSDHPSHPSQCLTFGCPLLSPDAQQ